MPRAVSPWTWRRALRDHGPESPSVLLTLFVIGTYMDRAGVAFPSQQLIAKGIRGSVKTVQRHIEITRRDGWLCVQTAGRGGKGWRHYAYRAAIPDRVPLDDLDEAIADSIEAIEGSLPERLSEPAQAPDKHQKSIVPASGNAPALRVSRSAPASLGEDTIVSPPSPHRGDSIVSPRKPENLGCPVDVHRTKPSVTASVTEADGVRHDRGDTGEAKVATNGAEGDDISGTSWRHNSVALTPALRTPASITRASEEAHNAQSRVASAPNVSSKGEEQEPESQPRPGITDAQLWRVVNDIGPDHEYKVSTMTKILSARYLDVTEGRLWRVIRAEQARLSQRRQTP